MTEQATTLEETMRPEYALDREYRLQEAAEQGEIEREQIAAGTHYYDKNTGTVREKPVECCPQCDAHDGQLYCEACGEPVKAEDCEPYAKDGGEIMACHPCIVRMEDVKTDLAAEEHEEWLSVADQLGELPHGGWRRS